MTATIIYNERFNEPTIFSYPVKGNLNDRNLWEKLEEIWRDCNHIDGTEWIASQNKRSMSVGDMILLQGKLYCAMSAGFIQID